MLEKFKKDYSKYLAGILIPAVINFLTIPFFKLQLGTENFGVYSYYFSILLIINSSLSGGMTQSIIRLNVEYLEVAGFHYQCLIISTLLQLAISLPVFFFIQLSNHNFSFSLLFLSALFASNLYTTLSGITQAQRKSGFIAISEALRTVLFLSVGLTVLYFFPELNYLKVIFFSILLSYSIGCLFLFYKNNLQVTSFKNYFLWNDLKKVSKEIGAYGGFLIGWFFSNYAVTYGNRFILALYYGKSSIGHYTASFDILNKSIVLVLSPVLMSLFPLLVAAHSHGDTIVVKSSIKRLIGIELVLMVIAVAAFYLFGFNLLSKLLATPVNSLYFWLDLQIIASTFIWQIAMLQHKFLELEKKTKTMLLSILFAVCTSICTDIILIKENGIVAASFGFLVGSIVYLFAVTFFAKSKYATSSIS